jgi:hypothetical protein
VRLKYFKRDGKRAAAQREERTPLPHVVLWVVFGFTDDQRLLTLRLTTADARMQYSSPAKSLDASSPAGQDLYAAQVRFALCCFACSAVQQCCWHTLQALVDRAGTPRNRRPGASVLLPVGSATGIKRDLRPAAKRTRPRGGHGVVPEARIHKRDACTNMLRAGPRARLPPPISFSMKHARLAYMPESPSKNMRQKDAP